MKEIEKKIKTKAHSRDIWQAWASMYKYQGANEKPIKFEKGVKGHVLMGKGRPVPFEILEMDKGKSFTIAWKSHFLKMVFTYKVEPRKAGSTINCHVKFKGIFSYPLFWIIRKKVEKDLEASLMQFVSSIEQSRGIKRR